ncbi:hypothetical protein P7C73_g5435, partial [Tremellales sp. Uapishka_1]
MSASTIDAQFHRAVDIVQSLPKGGPLQTSYEEKLGLYSLYKQGTEGDISISRPGMLDMLGRAKWDSWNKQRGVDKVEAKRLYVAALLKILRKYSERESARGFIRELEEFVPERPASPASSTSSYHSSQASPPESRSPILFPPPDPSLPAPDVAPEIVPPSALSSSHRSLLNLAHALPPTSRSRPQSSVGGWERKESINSFRPIRGTSTSAALGFVSEQHQPQPLMRDYGTPEAQFQFTSPYLGIQQPTPSYPYPTPNRPASASTFHQPQSLNLAQTLQAIQTSLSALHERLSTLEKTQAMILRRDERKKSWFWGSKEDEELDEMEDENDRRRYGQVDIGVRAKQGLSFRVAWGLIHAVKRAMLDVGVGMLVVLVGVIVFGGGWRRVRGRLLDYRRKISRMLIKAIE